MPRKQKIMPIGLQIYNLKRVFLKANSDYPDPEAELDEIDWEILDSTTNFEENLELMEREYPRYNWRIEKRKAKPKWQHYRDQDNDIYTVNVRIASQEFKSKNHLYLKGRIQVTVDPNWIGRMARIIVRIPVRNEKRLKTTKHDTKRGHF